VYCKSINFGIIIRPWNTGKARNFDWGKEEGERIKLEKIYDVILVTFFGDVMVMTSLKWRHN